MMAILAKPVLPRILNFVKFSALLISASILTASGRGAEAPVELVVYTYDTLNAKGGLGPEILPLFEKKCGCKVKMLSSGDAGQLLSRLQLDSERRKPTAHVVWGLDEPIWERAKPFLETSWGDWTPAGYSEIVPEARMEKGFLPFDFGYYTFIVDTQALKELKLTAPKALSELLQTQWKRNLILQDPRTSTPGLAFVLYASQVSGAGGAGDFWRKFRPQWLTLTPGWDQAYGLFLKKEAPLVWSYTSSQAYHEENGDATGEGRRYRALLLEEGQPVQVEGAALVRGTPRTPAQLKAAREFLEFLISPEAQKQVPRKNWMYPVIRNADLPPSFKNLPKPKKAVRLPSKPEEIKAALKTWSQAVEAGR